MTQRHPCSPSSADRWINCHGYYEMVKDIPPTPSSRWAVQGTQAHSLLELALMTGLPPKRLHKNQEFVKAVTVAFDYINPFPLVFPELKVRIQMTSLLVKGTTDALCIDDRLLEGVDYKHGSGVYVDSKLNPQLTLYVGAAREEYGTRKRYKTTVIQPRVFGRNPIRSNVLTDMELDDFLADADRALSRNLQGSHGPRAGSWCRFCPAMGVCPAARRKAIGEAFPE